MTQQINLLTHLPREEEQKHIISDSLLKTIGKVVLLAFAAIFLIQILKLSVNSQKISSLEQDQQDLQQQLAALEAQYPEETKLLLEQQGQRIQGEIVSKGEMLKIMQQELDEIPNFSEPLEALARTITAGVWLTQIEIDHENNSYRFTGRAFEVDQVLSFIANLGKDPYFSTVNFKVFEVLQGKGEEGYISFILATG